MPRSTGGELGGAIVRLTLLCGGSTRVSVLGDCRLSRAGGAVWTVDRDRVSVREPVTDCGAREAGFCEARMVVDGDGDRTWACEGCECVRPAEGETCDGEEGGRAAWPPEPLPGLSAPFGPIPTEIVENQSNAATLVARQNHLLLMANSSVLRVGSQRNRLPTPVSAVLLALLVPVCRRRGLRSLGHAERDFSAANGSKNVAPASFGARFP